MLQAREAGEPQAHSRSRESKRKARHRQKIKSLAKPEAGLLAERERLASLRASASAPKVGEMPAEARQSLANFHVSCALFHFFFHSLPH